MALNYGSEQYLIREKESFDTYEPLNSSQELAYKGLKQLVDLIIEHKGDLGEPAIIGIQGEPGVGKTHLLNSVKNELKKNNIDFVYNVDEHLLFEDINYKGSKIVVIDDLFQDKLDFSEIDKYDLMKLRELIFNVYESQAILFVSSNFDIKEILDKVALLDKRIKSRVSELLGHTMPIQLEGEDYRTKKAKNSKIKTIFDGVVRNLHGTIS